MSGEPEKVPKPPENAIRVLWMERMVALRANITRSNTTSKKRVGMVGYVWRAGERDGEGAGEGRKWIAVRWMVVSVKKQEYRCRYKMVQ